MKYTDHFDDRRDVEAFMAKQITKIPIFVAKQAQSLGFLQPFIRWSATHFSNLTS